MVGFGFFFKLGEHLGELLEKLTQKTWNFDIFSTAKVFFDNWVENAKACYLSSLEK